LTKGKPAPPLSDAIPSLTFIDGDINSGGLCDLQFVIIQLVNKSNGGLEFIQLLTASLYLFETCFDTLNDSIATAEATYPDDDKSIVVAELKRMHSAYSDLLSRFTDMHLGLSATASFERMAKLLAVRGEQMQGDDDGPSALLISDALLNSLGIDRNAVNSTSRTTNDTLCSRFQHQPRHSPDQAE